MGREFSILDAPLTGVMLIDAGAGTGKTYTISSLVVRLLLEKDFAISEILVVTYTEAAADDLKTRVRGKLIDAAALFAGGDGDDAFLRELSERVAERPEAVRRLTAALRNFDEAAIFTIHGFCRRVLNEHSLESAVFFDSELLADQHDLLKEIAEDFFRKNLYEAPALVASRFFREFAPANLLGKARDIHAREEIRIIPELDGKRSLKELATIEPEYRRLFHDLACLWPAKRQVVAALLSSEALNKNKYKPGSVPGWLAEMDGLTARLEPPARLFKDFGKFTSSAVAGSAKAGRTPPVDEFFDLCEIFHQSQRKIATILDDYGKYLEGEFYRFMRSELKVRKEAAGAQSFDDLLTDLHRALQGRRGAALAGLLRRRYPAAMIDEFQDTDPVQYEIFSKIFQAPGSLLYLIGDPKQAIYSFRGADIFAYIRAVREVADRYTLERNWRSVPGLVAAVNAVFGGRETPFVFAEIVFDPARTANKEQLFLKIDRQPVDPFRIWVFGRDGESRNAGKLLTKEDAVQRILTRQTAEVSRLLRLGREGRAVIGEHPLVAGDLAILVRTNHEARQVQESLGRAGIASGINSSESLFASREAVELRTVLHALVDAGDIRRVRAALATRIIGAEGALLDVFGDDDGFLVDWLGKFRKYRDIWAEAGFAAMFGLFLENEGVRARLLRLPEGERSLTNVLHLFEVLHLAGEEHDLGMAGLVKYLGERIASPDENPAEEQQLRLESDADLVQIVTIHKAKGLQYPVVFCPFCWGGGRLANRKTDVPPYLFHDPAENNELKLDIGSADVAVSRRHAVREELAENLRLLYVALTRAINRCYLAWGPFKGAGTAAAAYLLHGGSSGADGDEAVGVDYLEGLSDAEIAADLELLAGRADGGIGLDFVDSPVSAAVAPPAIATGQNALSCRRFTTTPVMNWRISSFSALSRQLKTAPFNRREETAAVAPAHTFGDITSFPRGAAPGSFLHAVLEDLDFAVAAPAGRAGFLRERLAAGGYDPAWEPALAAMIDKLLTTPLDRERGDLVLAGLERKARLTELEFYFPLADFNPAGLAGLLGDLIGPSGPAEKIRGFMKGYIDLVFCRDEKFYIVDWKSNYLGDQPEDYRPEKLRAAMAEEHYFLQYLIYTVALHRYLAARLPGYDYETNFGGVFYLFLRGLGGCGGPDTGVFRDKPRYSLVSDLAELFGG
ncbi:MAG: exodeoxyribonuclease V subunit beta [Desulfurivibrionaceae bacterium]|nr:exodeoxyribonuclease V subunit beta [Desulfurivibrionaceae bacterium]